MSFSSRSFEPLFFIDGYPFFFNPRRSKHLKAPPLTGHAYCKRLRRIHSKGAMMVLFWVFLVWTSVNFVGEFADKLRLQVIGSKLLNRHNLDVSLLGREIPIHYAYYATIGAIWLLGTPFIGWLADSYFGRYKVMAGSLWVMWWGLVVHSCLYLGYNHDQPSGSLSTIASIASFVALTVYMCGLVGFLINSIQFGMDQMPDASSPEHTAFIHWYVFALSAGVWFSDTVLGLLISCMESSQEDELSTAEIVVLPLLPTLLLSLALLSDSFLRHHLIIEPHSKNPFKLVVGVLRYFAKHSKPANPSAYVFTLKTIPKRLDFAKAIYGGPYTTEQVEDVKTFLRILFLMSPGILLLTGNLLTAFNVTEFEEHLKSLSSISSCTKASMRCFSYDYRLLTMILIVINELLVQPLCVKWSYICCKTLRRIVIGTALSLILSLALVLLEIAGHSVTHPQVPCMFVVEDRNVSFINISYLPVAIPVNFVLALQAILFISGTWEFICAQAPYYMRGLLIGAAWASLAIATILTNVITIGWYLGSNGHKYESGIVKDIGCGGFYFLSVFFISLLGLVLFCVAVCRYRPRVREEEADQQLLVEEIYAKEVNAAGQSSKPRTTDLVDDPSAIFPCGTTCTNSSIQ